MYLKEVWLWCFSCNPVYFVFPGVYLSKYSDLLQINPFEVGSSGDMIVFKVMKVWLPFCPHVFCAVDRFSNSCVTRSSSVWFAVQGRVKHIHESMPKNAIEPSPKFDGHVSKSANRVTSLLSYRAFELTQVNSASLLFAYYRDGVIQVLF